MRPRLEMSSWHDDTILAILVSVKASMNDRSTAAAGGSTCESQVEDDTFRRELINAGSGRSATAVWTDVLAQIIGND